MNKVEKISPARSFAHKLWTIGVNDPKKAIHALKVGLALSLVSLFYYVRPLYDGVAGSAIAAILTVAVVFEYHAGGTICRTFNRVSATFLAGFFALGIHIIADRSTKEIGHIVHGTTVFLVALVASFARFVPVVKARYDYGMLVFIVTFTLISLSGHRMEKVLDLAKYRSYTVALGSFICVLVSMLIRPAWAGKELHKLVVGNTEKLANSLEGDDAKCKDSLQKIYGYKSILTSKALEERLAPEITRDHLCSAFMRLSFKSSTTVKELARTMKEMRKSSSMDDLIKDMRLAAEELQITLRTLPNWKITRKAHKTSVNTGELSNKVDLHLLEVIPLATVTSLLMEISIRIEQIASAVNDLAKEVFTAPLQAKEQQHMEDIP
ncbi:hypothetical protein HPP92_006871 [Vanilla planifolia]|uniref:Aluminum-activated malate transporter n=1 Tax=Vanilla planifolia TaxID=51239 RepID=A0A835RPQ4_VANPL|nr:hypothetical protein HPP92_006871 [Vanilla planifolia]